MEMTHQEMMGEQGFAPWGVLHRDPVRQRLPAIYGEETVRLFRIRVGSHGYGNVSPFDGSDIQNPAAPQEAGNAFFVPFIQNDIRNRQTVFRDKLAGDIVTLLCQIIA